MHSELSSPYSQKGALSRTRQNKTARCHTVTIREMNGHQTAKQQRWIHTRCLVSKAQQAGDKRTRQLSEEVEVEFEIRRWRELITKDGNKLRPGWTESLIGMAKDALDPSCVLSFYSSCIKDGYYWRAYAKCTFPDCCRYFLGVKDSPMKGDDSVMMVTKRFGVCNHDGSPKRRWLKGKKRREIGSMARGRGAILTQQDLLG